MGEERARQGQISNVVQTSAPTRYGPQVTLSTVQGFQGRDTLSAHVPKSIIYQIAWIKGTCFGIVFQ